MARGRALPLRASRMAGTPTSRSTGRLGCHVGILELATAVYRLRSEGTDDQRHPRAAAAPHTEESSLGFAATDERQRLIQYPHIRLAEETSR